MTAILQERDSKTSFTLALDAYFLSGHLIFE